MKRSHLLHFMCAGALLTIPSCSSDVTFSGSMAKTQEATATSKYGFTTSQIVEGSVSLTDGGRYMSVDLTQAETPPFVSTQSQVTRKIYSEPLRIQGHKAKFSTEQFQLSSGGMLDFLVIVDDSSSMEDKQAKVATGLNSLIANFKDTNWQIAVISESNPCVDSSNLIKKTDPDAASKFAKAVVKPYDSLAIEQGFPMAIQSLKGQCNGAQKPWLRTGSTLGILVLSDEDNCGSDPGGIIFPPSDQSRCSKVVGKNTAEMLAFLNSIRSPIDFRFYSIVDTDNSCGGAGGKGKGYMYLEASSKTGGTVANICKDYTDADGYGAFLKTVSTDVSKIMKKQFTLTASPDMAQFNVVVDGQTITSSNAYTVKGNVVTINPGQITSGSNISFSYTHDAIPMFTEIPITAAPNLDTLEVTIDGKAVTLNQDFTYNPSKKSIVFTSPPPEDSKVKIDYLEEKTLAVHFAADLSGVYSDTLKVSINGTVQDDQNYHYDATGIDFTAPPMDGAKIQIQWQSDANKILSYAAAPANGRHVVTSTVKDKATGEDIPAQWSDKNIVFAPDLIKAGRVVTVAMDFGAKSASRTFTLPDNRLDDDVVIMADGQDSVCGLQNSNDPVSPEASPSSPTVVVQKPDRNGKDKSKMDADTVDLSSQSPAWKSRYKGTQMNVHCKEGADYSNLSIKYKHEIARTNKFKVNVPPGVDPNDPKYGWVVKVDDKVTTQFKRTGAEIEIEDDVLPPGSKVEVSLITYTKVTK